MDALNLPWKPLYMQEVPASASIGMDEGGAMNATTDAMTDSVVKDGGRSEELSLIGYYVFAATLAFTVFVYAFEGVLDGRQKSSYKKTKFPPQLETTVAAIDVERAKQTKEREQEQAEKTKDEDANKKKDEDKTKKSEDNDEDAESKKDKVDKDKPLLPQLQNKFQHAQAYGLDKINFGMIASTYDTIESVAFLLLGFLPYMWDVSRDLGRKYFEWDEVNDEIKVSLIFLALTTIIGTITSLPFEYYSTFYIERKHGFNKQTIGLFVTDKIKSLILTMVIGGPFVSLLLYIIKKGGQYFYIYVWIFMFCFSVFMMTIVPVFIMPLFNKYEPLEDGPLKTSIYELAGKLKFPLTKLFVMDGSKRSSHSNAFMFGFGNNKRIVLFDTLISQVTQDEILAILGHELGHWKLGHTLINFVVTQVYMGAAFYVFSLTYTNTDLHEAFGFTRVTPTIVSLLLFFSTIWAPVDKILSFVLTVFSRMNEFAADRFSVDLGMSKKLQSGLCKIHLENLGAMCPDPWYSMYHYSHPPLVERLSAMMELDKKQK